MSDNTRTNPKPQHGAQAGKRSLLLSFIIFMAWVVIIGLLLSLMSCQPNEPITFVIKLGSP